MALQLQASCKLEQNPATVVVQVKIKTLKRFQLFMKCIQSGMEEVPALVWRKKIADFADGFDELIEGPGADAPEVRLEFREGHFDRVEIRTAGRNRKWHPWALSIRVAVSLLRRALKRFVFDVHRFGIHMA